MSGLAAWIETGGAVDLGLAVLAVEAVALALAARLGRGPGLRRLAPTLAAGAGLLLALRAEMAGAGWAPVALALAAAAAAHVIDVSGRLAAPDPERPR